MEEEIPTALYLLRMIPKSSLEGQLGLSYAMFLISAMCRLAIGYMFLFNVLLVVVQSDRVLGKFDVMCKLVGISYFMPRKYVYVYLTNIDICSFCSAKTCFMICSH